MSESSYAQTIRDNYQRVDEAVSRAAEQAGRSPQSVVLVGVTKYVDAASAAALHAAGCQHLGESRPQELQAKTQADAWPDGKLPTWHMVGHLQRNKVDITLPAASVIHSVDSERLLKAIHKEAEKQGRQPAIMLQTNCSGEEAKYGLTADETRRLANEIENYPHVRLTGLMTMAARVGGAEVAAKNFATLRQLQEQIRPSLPQPETFTELSMGMSGDFEAAIAEGATLLRIGSALWEGVPRRN